MRHPSSRILITAALGAVGMACAAPANAQTSPSAYTSVVRYDLSGRQTGTIAPDPDSAGQLKFAATRTTYDNRGRPIKVESGELATWQSEAVAPANWPMAPTDPAGFTVLSSVETTFDNEDRKIKDVAKGNTGTIISVTQYSYDSMGRLECTAVRMNSAVFGSLPASACTVYTEGVHRKDRITKNVYGLAGQLLKVQKAFGTPLQQDYVTYTYTVNGKQETVTDANGTTAKFTYDGFDRLIRWNFASKTTAGVASTTDYEEYAYDVNGNRTSLRKRDGSVIAYTYDVLNRVTLKDVDATNVRINLPATHKRDVHYGYDLRGLQTYARFDSVSGEGLTTVYDGFGRPLNSTLAMDGTSRLVSYLFDANGNRTRVKHPDGKGVNYEYDGLDRVKGYLLGTTSLGILTYNTRGLRKTLTGAAGAGVPTSYNYDSIGRLSNTGHNLGGAATTHDVTFSLTYNPASQAATQTTNNDSYVYTGSAPASRAYVLNGLNQYSSAGPRCFDHDGNGNLTADKNCANPTDSSRTDYLYDVENRLVSASGATTAGMRYDPLGRLYETAGAATTRFLYDGDELISEYDTAGNILRRYVHGPGNDDPLVWFEGPGVASAVTRHIRTNHQGSVVSIASDTGISIAINAYDEWGVPNGLTTPTTTDDNMGRFQYTGQAWIAELGMYHYKARIYSPTLGRFLQIDPIGYNDDMNLYSYVKSDPVNLTDPTGASCSESESPGKGQSVSMKCKFDDRASFKKAGYTNAQIRSAERQYTRAVNNLLRNADKTHTIKVGTDSFKATAGQIAYGLKNAFVTFDKNTSDRANMAGGSLVGVDPQLANGGQPYRLTIGHNFFKETSGYAGPIFTDQRRTLIHEGIHTVPDESAMIDRYKNGSFRDDHAQVYRDAATIFDNM